MRWFIYAAVGLICVFVLANSKQCVWGAEDAGSAPAAGAQAWHLQRLLVPADRPEDWPREKNQRYLPLPAEEFERRLAQLRSTGVEPAVPPPARLVSAEYTARLEGNELVDGEAVWQFEHTGKDRNVLVLNGAKLPIAEPRWVDPPQSAVLGNDQFGRMAVVVDRAGKMHCTWSLRGQRDSGDALSFALRLPACPITTLHLTLPAELVPQIDRGLVSPDGKAERGQARWTIDLGGTHQATLQLVKRDSPREDPPVTLAQSALKYDVSPRGLELAAEFRFSVVGRPLRKLQILLDRPLSPVRARMGDADLPITLAADNGQGAVRAEIEFPEDVQGFGHLLNVTAVAPITLDAAWKLPTVRLADSRWEDGQATLRIAAPLVLDDLRCSGCRQTKAEATTEPVAAETIGIQCFSNLPEMEVLLTHRRPRVHLMSGVSVSLRGNECTARYAAKMSAQYGERFALEAEVAPQWIIDNVECEPAGRIVDWSYEALPGKPGKLRLQLGTPLSPQHDLRVVVTSRRRRAPAGERLRTADLEMLKFADVDAGRQLIHLHSVDPYQLQLVSAETLHRLDPAQLTAADAALLQDNPAGLVFLDDAQARGLAVSLSTRPPRYQAEIHAEAVAHDSLLTESYRFSITPQGREMAGVIVRFSQPRGEPVTWTSDGSDSTGIRARRLSEAEQLARGLVEGEAWEVLFSTPRTGPFEFQAVRQLPLRSETPVALAALSGAESQRGSVQVRSTGTTWPELRSRRLATLPVELPPAGQQSTVLASFRYEPEEDTLLVAEPPLVIVPRDDRAAANSAWIWQAKLDSRYERGGAEHVFSCRVENTGREEIDFRLSAGAKIRGVWLNDQAVANSATGDSERCRIPLPSGARFVSITLQWSDDDQSGIGRTVACRRAPWPECDVPVMARQWTVCVPPGLEVREAEIGGRTAIMVPWPARLFGPLARTAETDNFSASVPSSGPSSAAIVSGDSLKTGDEKLEEEKRADETAKHKSAVKKNVGLISPWKVAEHSRVAEPMGWTIYRFDDSTVSAGEVWMVDRRAMAAWEWGLFVLVAGIGWRVGRRTLTKTIFVLCIATAIALAVPAVWTSLASAAWLGLVAGILLARMLPERAMADAKATPANVSTSKSTQFAHAAGGLALLAMIAWQHYVHAEEPAVSGSARRSDIRQVLIPIDQDQHPTGGLYYVTEAFHDELMHADADAQRAGPKYLITQAVYRATLGRDAATGEANSGDWVASFEIESFTDAASVKFPLDVQNAAIVPDGVKLDGQPVLFQWGQEQKQLAIEIASTGRHQLEVLLRPKWQHGEVDFAIPAVCTGRLDLSTTGNEKLEVESSLGTAASNSGGARAAAKSVHLTSWLGPTERITIRPQESGTAASSSTKTANFDVDELYWLKVRPGSVTVDCRYRIKVHEGSLQQLRLMADSHLLPLTATNGAVVKVKQLSDKSNLVSIDLARPVTDEARIDVSYLVDGASGMGAVNVPQVDMDGAGTRHRVWGASIDPALDYTATPGAGVESVPPSQFSTLWGSEDVKPQLAWETTVAKAAGGLTTRLHEVKLTTRYQLALDVAEESVGVRLAANVTSQGGTVFQYRLSVPAAFEVDDVTASDQRGERAARWTRCGDDLLAIMLGAGASGEIKLLVRGHMPRPSDKKFALPELKILGSESEKYRALVTRNSDVLVEVTDAAGMKVAEASEAAAAEAEAMHDGLLAVLRPGEEQLVAVLEGPQVFHAAVLSVEHNRPQTTAAQAISLSRNADAWQAAVDLHLQIADGLIDALRFDLPSEWSGPFKITPPMPYTVEEIPGENRKQLVVSPEVPLRGTAHVHIAGPLTVAGGQRPSAPDVHLVGAARPAQYIVLPRRIEDQQLAWDTRGLMPKPLPEELAELLPNAGTYRSYQQLGGRYPVLRSAERSTEDPQVRLADNSLSWDDDGRCWGVTALDLEPAGATSCLLQVPEGYQLVRTLLDGAGAQCLPLGENRWNIWLGDNKLPRRLEVVFAGHLRPAGGAFETVQAPELVDLPVERTLWMISAPKSAGTGMAPSGTAVSGLRHELLRFEGVTTLADSAAGLLLEESSDDVLRWYGPWGKRFLDSRWALARLQSTGAEDHGGNAADEIASTEQDHARLARRLGTSNLMSQISSEPVIASEAERLWEMEQLPGRKVCCAMIRGEQPALSVAYYDRRSDDGMWRWIAAALFLLISGAMVLARRRGWFNLDQRLDPLPYGSPMVGLLGGLVWCLWLTPFFVGPAIIAGSLYAAWRQIRSAPSRALLPVRG